LRSFKKVFKKFGKLLTVPGTNNGLYIPNNYVKKTKDVKICNTLEPFKVLKWTLRTQFPTSGPCLNCGSMENIQLHHVRKLAKMPRVKPKTLASF